MSDEMEMSLGTFPEDGKWYDLKLGDSWKGLNKFHTLRYDFKPASIDLSNSVLEFGENNSVSITTPNPQDVDTPNILFQGNQSQTKKDFLLVVNRKTGEITLEKLESLMQVKKTRNQKPKSMIENKMKNNIKSNNSSNDQQLHKVQVKEKKSKLPVPELSFQNNSNFSSSKNNVNLKTELGTTLSDEDDDSDENDKSSSASCPKDNEKLQKQYNEDHMNMNDPQISDNDDDSSDNDEDDEDDDDKEEGSDDNETMANSYKKLKLDQNHSKKTSNSQNDNKTYNTFNSKNENNDIYNRYGISLSDEDDEDD